MSGFFGGLASNVEAVSSTTSVLFDCCPLASSAASGSLLGSVGFGEATHGFFVATAKHGDGGRRSGHFSLALFGCARLLASFCNCRHNAEVVFVKI